MLTLSGLGGGNIAPPPIFLAGSPAKTT